ncbi:MAG: arsenate reductase (glutaredoxin) [Cyclobacteriaceae bacterium]|nr:arsenate reductase (glutaredoxin) [Cyclobacteriaceae bacterium]
MKIYHNPRCSKSRETLQIIVDKGIEPQIVEYLKTPFSKKELKKVLELLKIPAKDLIRKNETVYKEQFKNKEFSEDEWLDVLVENPVLIERPIVVSNNKAVIGRPPENVSSLFNN